jgi:hypothetical protein
LDGRFGFDVFSPNGCRFLADITDEEWAVTGDQYRRERALAERLRAELTELACERVGNTMAAIPKLDEVNLQALSDIPVVWCRTRATVSVPELPGGPLLISLRRSPDTSA